MKSFLKAAAFIYTEKNKTEIVRYVALISSRPSSSEDDITSSSFSKNFHTLTSENTFITAPYERCHREDEFMRDYATRGDKRHE